MSPPPPPPLVTTNTTLNLVVNVTDNGGLSIFSDLSEDSKNSLIATFLFLGFTFLAWIWKLLFLWLMRCTKIQRWATIKYITRVLDLHDHLEHNTYPTLPKKISKDSYSNGTFGHGGVDLNRFNVQKYAGTSEFGVPVNKTSPNGDASNLDIELEMFPKLVMYQAPADATSSPYSMARGYNPKTGVNGVGTTPLIDKKQQQPQRQKDNLKKANVRFISGLNNLFGGCFGNDASDDIENSIKGDQNTGGDFHLGYSFKGDDWIVKHVERRTFLQYFRGNFISLFASSISAIFVITGAIVAARYAKIDIYYIASNSAFLAFIGILGLAGYLAPIIAHFGLLLSDHVERGDIVQVSTVLYGVGNDSVSLTGCVLDIGVWAVTLLTTEPYKTFGVANDGKISDNQIVVDPSGMLTPLRTVLGPTMSVAAENMQHIFGPTSTTPPPPLPQQYSVGVDSGIRGVSHIPIRERSNGDIILMMEHDQAKIKSVVSIPTHVFASAYVARKASWTPVANFQQVGRLPSSKLGIR